MRKLREDLPPATHIGRVRLRVSDLDRSLHFYGEVLGLRRIPDKVDEPPRSSAPDAERPAPDAALSASRRASALLLLDERPGALPAAPGSTGLFHFALRVPDRAALARVLRRIGESGWPLGGASDHAVSEALYLSDPDGNGIEVYADRPREQWSRRGDEIRMTTERLDLRELLRAADQSPGREDPGRVDPGQEHSDQEHSGQEGPADGPFQGPPDEGVPSGNVSAETSMGHIHLRVSDIAAAEAFYHGLLGFDVTVRSYPGALFLSAGGYHHHIGANIWQSRGGSRAPEDAAGLVDFAVVLPDDRSLERVAARVRDGGVDVAQSAEGDRIHDPDGNVVVLVS